MTHPDDAFYHESRHPVPVEKIDTFNAKDAEVISDELRKEKLPDEFARALDEIHTSAKEGFYICMTTGLLNAREVAKKLEERGFHVSISSHHEIGTYEELYVSWGATGEALIQQDKKAEEEAVVQDVK